MREKLDFNIRGIEPYSTMDGWYGPATVLFIGGCNFRCWYCHNMKIVMNRTNKIDFDDVLQYIHDKSKWISEIVLSGGEPLLQPNLSELIDKIKEIYDFKIHLYTNGYFFEELRNILPKIDVVSMDIKYPIEKYNQVTGVEVNPDKIFLSINLLNKMSSEKVIVFRTTVWKNFGVKNIETIRNYIDGDSKYKIQNYLGKEFQSCPASELEQYSRYQIF